ncbi:MAG: hypothetical protein AB1768_16520 [Pseudomonadota bacterium]|jgi:hypothetical protein
MSAAYRNGSSEISLGVECAYMPQLVDVLRQARTGRAADEACCKRIAWTGRLRLAAAAALIAGAGALLMAIHYAGF